MGSFGKRTGGGRRAAVREPAPLIAVFTTVTRSHAATLVDISATGARLRGDDLPARGDLVELSIGNVRAFGIIKWVRAGQCGVAFDGPLAAADVELLRDQVKQARGLPPEIRGAYDDWVVGLAR